MIVKTEDINFVKDSDTNTIINTDVEGYRQYKLARESRKQFARMEKRIDALELQIKQLIEKLEQNG